MRKISYFYSLLLTALFLLPWSGTAWSAAHRFDKDGVGYYAEKKSSSTVLVYTLYSGGSYSGDIVIPGTTSYNDGWQDYNYTVTGIKGYAFQNCSGLTSVTIEEGPTTLQNYSFTGCANLTSVTLPSTISSVTYYTFQNCASLESVTFAGTTPPTGYYATTTSWPTFASCPSLANIYVPAEAVETYKSTWPDVASKIQAIPAAGCTTPKNLAAEAASSTAAEVTWTAGASETAWQLRYREKGTESWSDLIDVTTNPARNLTSLTTDKTYEVQVRSNCGEGDENKSDWTASAEFSLVSCPAVTGVSFDGGTYKSVTVNWTTGSATNCDVRYKEADDADWTSAETNTSATSKTITGLVVGKTYSFQVKPNCSADGWVAAGETYTPAFPVPVPSVSDQTDAQATVSWSALLDNPNYKYIYVAAGSAAPDAEAWAAATPIALTSATLTGLVGGTSYDVYVLAVYVSGEGEPAKVNFSTTTVAPTDLVQGSTTTSSIAFSWSYAGAATQFQWRSSKSGSTWSDPISATNAEETGLSDGETYSFDVRAYYADGKYSSLLTGSFNTACEAKDLPYSCGFETSDEDVFAANGYNNCWKKIGSPYASTNSTYRHTGSRGLYFGGTDEQYAILPVFEDAVKGMQISFWYKNYLPSYYTSTLVLGSMTDPTDKTTFTAIKTLDASSSFVQIVEQSLATAGTNDHYIAFKYTGENTYSAIGLDDISVTALPTCPKPTGVTIPAANITGTTAQVSWTENGSATAWKIQTSNNGTNWGDAISADTNPFTLTTLTPNQTTYYVRVMSDCGGGDVSDWSDASDPFQTDCETISSFPWDVNFDDMTADKVPSCWDNSASTPSEISSHPEYIWGVYEYSNNKMLRMYNYYLHDGNALINTPSIELPASPLYELSFDYAHNASCGNLVVKVSTDGGSSFADISGASYAKGSGSSYSAPGTFTPATIDLSSYAGSTIVLQFYSLSDSYSSADGAIFIDNLSIHAKPSCTAPTLVTASNITKNSASITWTNGGEETSWKVQYKAEGDVEWTNVNDGNAITGKPVALNGLTPQTTYYVRVKALCDVESEWSGEGSFPTDCDTQAMPITENFGTTLPECWKTAESGADAWAPDASKYVSSSRSMRFNANTDAANYADLITPTINITDEANLKFQLWNNSYLGTVTGELYVDNGTATKLIDLPTTSNWEQQTIDLTAYIGQGVKFIFRAYGNNTAYTYMYIDDVEVKVKPCDAPAFAAANVVPTVEGATVSCDADAWSLRYRKGTDEWTEVLNLTASSYEITGCEFGTTYEVQVRTDCSATRHSAWTASQNFVPACLAPTALSASNISASGATISWNGAAKALRYKTGDADWSNESLSNATSFNLTGLVAQSTYTVQVKATCEDDDNWSALLEFTTACGLASAEELPLNEDFSAGVKPACWQFVTTSEYPIIANNKIWFQGEAEQIAVFPGFDINLNQLAVSFDYTASNASIEFGYIPAAGGAFQSLGAYTSGALLDLTSAPAAKGYLAVRYYDATSSWSTGSVDNVHVTRHITLADADDNTATLNTWMNKTVDVTIGRTLKKATYFNTLCLPFDLSTLDETPLEGGELWAFRYINVDGDSLYIRIIPSNNIEAGVPYLICWPNATDVTDIANPLFKNVTIGAAEGKSVGESNLQFRGILEPEPFYTGDRTKLFVAANNTLYWWAGTSDSQLNGFRAFFHVATGGDSPFHGMPARLIKQEETPTDVEQVQGAENISVKVLENNQVVIIRNGVKYTVQGQKIQ